MKWLEVANECYSSYKENNLGWVFYSLVRAYKPLICVEIGTLEGYSAIFTAAALQDNGQGDLTCFDLWDKYPHRHVPKSETQERINQAGLSGIVSLCQLGAQEVPNLFTDVPIDFLHIDISNKGDTLLWATEAFQDALSPDGLLLFEGGSEARDNIEWMVKYKQRPISPVLSQLDGWEYFVIEPYPSITILRKRR